MVIRSPPAFMACRSAVVAAISIPLGLEAAPGGPLPPGDYMARSAGARIPLSGDQERSASMYHAVVLCGGSGTRLWPLTRQALPKQFLSLTTERPLLVETVARLKRLAPAERIWLVGG